jgi:flagellar assembly factor FliW
VGKERERKKLKLPVIARQFEEIEIEETDIINLTQGLIGFPALHKYAVLVDDEVTPFQWFQCLDDPSLAFVIINPLLFKPDYRVKISREEIAELGINNPAKVTINTIVTIPPDPGSLTANLQAPILINNENRLGKQVILMNNEYSTRHLILEELQKNSELSPTNKGEIITICPIPDSY